MKKFPILAKLKSLRTDVDSLNDSLTIHSVTSSHITMSIGEAEDSIGFKNAYYMELRLKTKAAVNINNGQLLGTLESGFRLCTSAYLPTYDYNTGKPVNGSIYATTDGKLTYYGDNITSKVLLIHATYALL